MTMAVEYTRKPSLAAAFRFQSTPADQSGLHRCVDVIVGIQRLGVVLRWEGWCSQLVSNSRKELAAVFYETERKMQRLSKSLCGEGTTPGALCSLFGHDVHPAEVTIKDVEQQGRPYLSIQSLGKHKPTKATENNHRIPHRAAGC